MAEKRQMLPDHPTVTDLYAVIGELQDQLASMHEECDEHEENDGDIMMELRAENERLRQDRDDADRDVETLQEVLKRQDVEIERLRAALRQILDDPEALILDSHRHDGHAALGDTKGLKG